MKNKISMGKINIQPKVSDIRKKSFFRKYNLDSELIELIKDSPSNNFLSNPPIHNIYQYLVDFVISLSTQMLEKDIDNIHILDWGSGKGHISYFLKKNNAEVVSCDIYNTKAHDSTFGQDTPIIKKYNIKVDPLFHAYELPYKSQSFDVVLSVGVLEHVPNDEESIKEISRILKKGGLFFCFHLPQPYSWTQKIQHLKGIYYHDRFYNHKRIIELTQIAGIEVLDVWHRAILPKNTINYPNYSFFEKLDLLLSENTPLKHIATNIEFVGKKK
jgi:2-polyprenyl-3-methyl-5-hydroxy-6-metoxy-1,4-benzoquinol methylase